MNLRQLPQQPIGTLQIILDPDFNMYRIIEWAPYPGSTEIHPTGPFRFMSAEKRFLGMTYVSKPDRQASLLVGIEHTDIVMKNFDSRREYSESVFQKQDAAEAAVLAIRAKQTFAKRKAEERREQIEKSVISTYPPIED